MADQMIDGVAVPTCGRIVHFVTDSGRHMPLVVTSTWPDEPLQVNGVVAEEYRGARAGELKFVYQVPYGNSLTAALGTWHWPERV